MGYLSLDYTAFEQYGTETSRKPSYSGTIRQRHFYTEPQVALLEAEFATEAFPNKDRRRRIALQLGVSEKSIMVSFVFFYFTNVMC